MMRKESGTFRLFALGLVLMLAVGKITPAQGAEPLLLNEFSISFAFTKDAYVIEASASAGGVITPSGTQIVPAGEDLSFSVTPQAGYRVVRLLVDGEAVEGENRMTGYRFGRVARDHTIHAEFAQIAAPTPVPVPTPRVIYVYVTASPAPTRGSGGGGARTVTPVPSVSPSATAMPGLTPAPDQARDDVPGIFTVPRNLGVAPE